MLESVSPCLTVAFRSDFKPVTLAGIMISVPAAMRVGSTMPGLAASSSCQREPRPRFCCASFQRESPGCMMTVWSGEEVFTEPGGGAMETVTLGFGKDGVIAGATMPGWTEGAMAGAVFGCGAAGAIRETGGGAE